MDHFAGLDVSVKDTSVCIVDDTGGITREVKVASEPDVFISFRRNDLDQLSCQMSAPAADIATNWQA